MLRPLKAAIVSSTKPDSFSVSVWRAAASARPRRAAAERRLTPAQSADQRDMRVDPPRRDDLPLAGDNLGAGANDDVDAGLNVGIAGLADAADPAVTDANIGFDNPPMIEDHGIGDDRVDGALVA